jgi:hypothetical protein
VVQIARNKRKRRNSVEAKSPGPHIIPNGLPGGLWIVGLIHMDQIQDPKAAEREDTGENGVGAHT